MTNKYSEGYPGARYYGGNEYVHCFRFSDWFEIHIIFLRILITKNLNKSDNLSFYDIDILAFWLISKSLWFWLSFVANWIPFATYFFLIGNDTIWNIYHVSFIGLCRYIDMAERLCQKRALEAFKLDPTKWGGNYIRQKTLFWVDL